MRGIPLGARDAGHLAEVVELDLGLRQVEVDRAAALAAAIQNHREVAHLLEALDQGSVLLPEGLVSLENCENFRVGHPLNAPDDPFTEVGLQNLALGVDLQQDRYHKAVLLRMQRASARRQLRGQHRHRPIREVDARAALASVGVER